MAKENNQSKHIQQKYNVLENARQTLKKEFIGIDGIIDEIIENVSAWYLMPQLLERPVVINLWGLTGVGKTSVVNRLAELLDYQDLYYRFDLGETEKEYSFANTVDRIKENEEDEPIIFALDEIQQCRTIIASRPTSHDKNRMVWDLLDNGKIQFVEYSHELWRIKNLTWRLYQFILLGIKVKDGIVYSHKQQYRDEFDVDDDEAILRFVPEAYYTYIINQVSDKLNLSLKQDLEKILLSGTAEENIQFLKKVIKIGNGPKVANFSKALIFVLGNLDEAYSMSGNYSSDMDADVFHRLSLKLNVPGIKSTLGKMFRDEQVARFGNIHIIYPALSRNSYEKIIKKELQQLALQLNKHFNVLIEFSDSIHQLIYEEGVYPSQGVRPVFTTIHQILKSTCSNFYAQILAKNIDADKLLFVRAGNKIRCICKKLNQSVFILESTIKTSLGDLRKNRIDDLQAITAVHESGHAVLSISLLGKIPEAVYSVSSDADKHGFVYFEDERPFIPRKEITARAAVLLGGFVAEKLIFGQENQTNGSGSDISKATQLLQFAFANSGFGKHPIQYGLPVYETKETYHNYQEMEAQVKESLQKSLQLAEQCLQKEFALLLKMSDYLSKNGVLSKSKIKELTEKYLQGSGAENDKWNSSFYRDQLKNKIREYGDKEPNNKAVGNTLILNSDKNTA